MSDTSMDLRTLRSRTTPASITSVCSAHPVVIEATLDLHLRLGKHALVEATSNQVNQFGGYTGMRPADFASFVRSIAERLSFPQERLILGGDHLGPYPFRRARADEAMDKARALVAAYVSAGYRKLHLDASMPLGGDSTDYRGALDAEIAAGRSALLCQAAEKARPAFAEPPVYVIGTEVPVPGGTVGTQAAPEVTSVTAFRETMEATRDAFLSMGLAGAWERVVAVVVQPGVEFGHSHVFEYDRSRTRALVEALAEYPGIGFEGHSTDYQFPEHLRQMAEDGMTVLKVGPALTFAFREGVFLLSCLENELALSGAVAHPSRLPETLEHVMRERDEHWRDYYSGDGHVLIEQMRYSLSDRCRYYWPDPVIVTALRRLLENVGSAWPSLSMLRQYFPAQYWSVRRGCIPNTPSGFLRDHIQRTLRAYPDLV